MNEIDETALRRPNLFWVRGVYLLLPLLAIGIYLQGRFAGYNFPEKPVAHAQEEEHGHSHDGAEGADHGHEHEAPEADHEQGVVHVALKTQAILGVETQPAATGDLALTLDLNGTIRPKPESIYDIHSPVEGIVLELHAFPGDWVRADSPLVTLQVPKILEWQETILHTNTEKESLARTKPLLQAEGEAKMIEFLGSLQAKSAEARHFQEELNILRSAGQGAVSRQEIHHKEGEYKASTADLLAKRALAMAYGVSQEEIASLESDLDIPENPKGLIAPEFLNLMAEKEIGFQKDLVRSEAAKANLRAIGFPEETIDRLEQGDTESLTNRLTLKSKSEGLLVESDINLRQAVTSEDHLFRIVDYRRVYIDAEVPERDIAKAIDRVQTEMPVRPLGMPDEILHATSVYLDTTVHPDRRVAHLVASMENLPGMTLRDGMAVTLGMVVGYEQEVLTVPAAAVQSRGLEKVVFVRDTKHPEDFVQREIRTGLSNLDEVEVLGGIEPGEEVVGQGAFHLLLALQQASGEGAADHGHAHH